MGPPGVCKRSLSSLPEDRNPKVGLNEDGAPPASSEAPSAAAAGFLVFEESESFSDPPLDPNPEEPMEAPLPLTPFLLAEPEEPGAPLVEVDSLSAEDKELVEPEDFSGVNFWLERPESPT